MARNIKAFHQIIKNNKETYKHNQNHNRDSGKKRKKIETHLTIIGVCTTTFPEKSGT
jgi:hypothetical protein